MLLGTAVTTLALLPSVKACVAVAVLPPLSVTLSRTVNGPVLPAVVLSVTVLALLALVMLARVLPSVTSQR